MWIRNLFMEWSTSTHIEIIPFDALQLNGDGVPPRLHIVDIAGTVRGQVGMTILEGRNFVFPMQAPMSVVPRTD